jgi:hypothetical protein
MERDEAGDRGDIGFDGEGETGFIIPSELAGFP